jgi:glyoxylate/hydroxypyruvate reductase
MTILVALRDWHMQSWVERFRALFPERRVFALGDSYDPADIIYAVSWKHPPGLFAAMPNLNALFSLGAGVDHLMGDPDLPDVPIVRVVDDDLTTRMSEYVVLHALSHLRQQRRYERQQRDKVWDDDRHQPAAHDVRVGIMGLGVLGQDAIAKLAAVGFAVAGWSRTPKSLTSKSLTSKSQTSKSLLSLATFAGADGLDAFLARTDILVCLLPLTPDTHGILNLGLLRKLARDGRLGGPVLINAGRGGLQREADIVAALDEGSLLAATLDVFETEPLPADSPLWSHPAVTVTPHNAAMSHPDAVARRIADQIRRLEAGGTLDGVIDRARGY